MVTIDFTGVDWYVVLAVSLGKLVVFFITMGIVLVVSRGRHIGLAGLLAIFTSQSNDVALAYPVRKLTSFVLPVFHLQSRTYSRALLSSSTPALSRPRDLHLPVCACSVSHTQSVRVFCSRMAPSQRKGGRHLSNWYYR